MPIDFVKAGSNNAIASVAQASADVNAAIRDLQATRDAEISRVIAKANADDANYRAATNLQQTTDPLTGNRMWQVKPTKS